MNNTICNETTDEKNERHAARNYLRGFIHYPELIKLDLHKKAYDYAKKLQIEYLKKSNDNLCSDEDLLYLIDVLLLCEDKNDKIKMTVADMNNFAQSRQHLLK